MMKRRRLGWIISIVDQGLDSRCVLQRTVHYLLSLKGGLHRQPAQSCLKLSSKRLHVRGHWRRHSVCLTCGPPLPISEHLAAKAQKGGLEK